ncbi:MAG: AI-2E family transporter [Chloroflexi bacterium]|nr:AI-2E family transporter [Chloroflexota bacterium]
MVQGSDQEGPRPGSTAPGQQDVDQVVRIHGLKRFTAFAVGVVLTILYLRVVGFVLLLFLAAACLASLLVPIARWLPGPRWLTGLVTGLGFFLGLAGSIYLLFHFMRDGVEEVRQEWGSLQEELDQVLRDFTARFGSEEGVGLGQVGDQVLAWLTGPGTGPLADIAGAFGAALISLALIVFGTLYLLAGHPEVLTNGLRRLAPRQGHKITLAIAATEERLRLFCVAMVISMVITGVLASIGFLIIGMPFAVPLAILASFSEVVPTLGPAIVFLLALLIAASQSIDLVILVAIVWLVVQTLESFVLVPIVLRRAVNVPPLVTMFTVVLWGRILGPLGLLLAVPLNLVVWTAVEHFYLKPREEQQTPP